MPYCPQSLQSFSPLCRGLRWLGIIWWDARGDPLIHEFWRLGISVVGSLGWLSIASLEVMVVENHLVAYPPSRDLVEVPQFWNSGVGNYCGNDPRWSGILVSGILEDGINLVEFLGLAIRWFPTTRFPELITILPQNGNPGPIKGAHPKYPISVSCVLLWAAMILLWYSLWPCYGFPVGWLSYCYSCPTGTPVATYVPHN